MPLEEIGRYTHESRTLPLLKCICETFYRVLVRKTEPSEITGLRIVQSTVYVVTLTFTTHQRIHFYYAIASLRSNVLSVYFRQIHVQKSAIRYDYL